MFDPAHHPGVTALASGGRPLCELAPLGNRQVAGLGAAVATTLADLHDVGVAHGAVSADRVLIRPDGRPLLRNPDAGGSGRHDPTGDVAALAEVLESTLAPAGVSHALRRVLAGARHPDPRRRPTARRLAQVLVDRVPGACLPVGGAPPDASLAGAPVPWRRRTRPAAIASAVVVAGLVPVALTGRVVFRPSTGHRSQPGTVAPRPVRPTPVPTTGAARYVIGEAADRVVVGRWHCQGSLAALLRPATGDVWAFDGWASPAHPLTAHLVARVPGADSLRVAPAVGTAAGCDRLLVTRRGAPPVELDPG